MNFFIRIQQTVKISDHEMRYIHLSRTGLYYCAFEQNTKHRDFQHSRPVVLLCRNLILNILYFFMIIGHFIDQYRQFPKNNK